MATTIHRNPAAKSLMVAGTTLCVLAVLVYLVSGGAPGFYMAIVSGVLFLVGGMFVAGHLVVHALRYSDKDQ